MDRSSFATLARDAVFPRVSVYVTTGPHGTETLQAPIRAKNALREAAEGLADHGLSPSAIEKLLDPARDRFEDPTEWMANGRGFAMFVGEEGVRVEPQPEPVDDLVVVGDRYHLLPYLVAMQQGDRYAVLAVGRGGFDLYRAHGPVLERIDVRAAVESVGDVRAQYQFGDDLGWHASTRGGRSAPAGPGGGATFHALGVSPEDFDDVVLDQFMVGVAKAVSPLLEEEGPLLVLAGGPREVGWLRSRLGRAQIAEAVVHHNAGRLDPNELGLRAWAIAEPIVRAARTSLFERLDRFLGGGDVPGSRSLQTIALAGLEGRVDLLFVDATTHVWGSVDGEGRLAPGRDPRSCSDEDLLNYVSLASFRTGGTILALPEGRRASAGPVSACFRW